MRGFTLVELITVLLLVSIIGVTALSRFQNSDLQEVQASRDQLVAALFFAQQKAMDIRGSVQLITGGNVIDVTVDGVSTGGDSFLYPVELPSQISLTSRTFSYNRLGETSASAILVSHSSGANATVLVASSGYAQ